MTIVIIIGEPQGQEDAACVVLHLRRARLVRFSAFSKCVEKFDALLPLRGKFLSSIARVLRKPPA
ncbi:MAG: hypothetical protein DCF16_01345 [Alphaproteobacteria bacterium]|nr:MAG: hypothetical protein DCF16_01345 [Alphaproteobacteria bacterium]